MKLKRGGGTGLPSRIFFNWIMGNGLNHFCHPTPLAGSNGTWPVIYLLRKFNQFFYKCWRGSWEWNRWKIRKARYPRDHITTFVLMPIVYAEIMRIHQLKFSSKLYPKDVWNAVLWCSNTGTFSRRGPKGPSHVSRLLENIAPFI